MSKTIVLFDLKNYSALSDEGKHAVVTEVFPHFASFLGDEDSHLVDTNTWGDSVIAIFDDTRAGANFALDVLNAIRTHRWTNRELHSLRVRIAVHVADLELGTDRLRALAKPGSHAFGTGIVVPARIEPIVPPNRICFTEDVKSLLEAAVRQRRVRATLRELGVRELVKGAGARKLFVLDEEGIPPVDDDDVAPADAASDEARHLNLLRIASLRRMNDYVEQFHVFTQSRPDTKALAGAFAKYHKQVLLNLRLGSKGRIEAHVLVVNPTNNRLETIEPPTDLEHDNWVSEMKANRARGGARPEQNSGVAVYSIWANLNGKPGVAVAPDVHATTDIDYYAESIATIGWFDIEAVKGMYRAMRDKAEKPPYRSLMSSAILRVEKASPEPKRANLKCVGALNITSDAANAFSHEDVAWIQVCGSLLGSLYQSRDTCRFQLAAEAEPPKKAKKSTK